MLVHDDLHMYYTKSKPCKKIFELLWFICVVLVLYADIWHNI